MKRLRRICSIAGLIFLIATLFFRTAHVHAEKQELTFIAVGDVMLSRGVGTQIRKHGPTYPFALTAELLRNADLTFANLETQISTLGVPMAGKEIHFRADTKSILGLMHAGIDVVSLSNNHSMDFGRDALFDTMDVLSHHGIAYVGAGMNETAARRSANFICNAVKVSVLAYSWNFYLTVEATAKKPGVAVIQREKTTEGPEIATTQRKKMAQDIKRAKAWADVVIVSFHWGWEYADHPTKTDRKTARHAIDAGADLVIGHHPHVVQGVEWYKGKLICYSLGNFIFDQRRIRTRRGLVLRCRFVKEGDISSAELLPITIHLQEFRPKIASGEEARSILKEVQKLSLQMKTKVRLDATESMLILSSQKGIHPQIAP